jgi:CheY-like chemotaxis protein
MSQNVDTRVLVADDNERMRDSTGALLESEGFNVSLACSGDEVIKALLSESFDLLLLDLKMPGLTGFEVMEYIEANEIDVEVIVVSGETSFDSVRFSLRHGAHDYLRKPFSVDDLSGGGVARLRTRRAVGATLLISGASGRPPTSQAYF